MFFVDVPPVVYADPWQVPFEDRLAVMMTGDRRVAYFYERPDNSTFRYRVYNMIQVLRGPGLQISAAFFCDDELDRLERAVGQIDVLVVCRARYSDRLERVITRARNKRKRVIFDIDDLVFDPDYVHLILHTLDQDLRDQGMWDRWFAYVGRVGAAMRLCDSVVTTNRFLAARVQEHTGKPVLVIPNFLNQEQMEISSRIYEQKRRRGFARDGRTHLGYFSGTPSHNKDLEIAANALARLLAEDSRLVVRIVGFMDLGPPLRDYASRIELVPLHDFVNLQRLIGSVEVNLVPLQDNVFTNCKSELKYFEAAVVGTVSVASPVYSYVEAIRDGENGFLARSFEWHEKLRAVLNAMESYQELAENAFADCMRKYAWHQQAGLIENALFP
jgi:glycosyltransferase involved in cell wall biosynthesis